MWYSLGKRSEAFPMAAERSGGCGVERVRGEDAFHERCVDGVEASDGGMNERLERELVDDAGDPLAGVEDRGHGPLADDVITRPRVSQVKTDVVAGVFDAERSKDLRVREACAQRLKERIT